VSDGFGRARGKFRSRLIATDCAQAWHLHALTANSLDAVQRTENFALDYFSRSAESATSSRLAEDFVISASLSNFRTSFYRGISTGSSYAPERTNPTLGKIRADGASPERCLALLQRLKGMPTRVISVTSRRQRSLLAAHRSSHGHPRLRRAPSPPEVQRDRLKTAGHRAGATKPRTI